MQAIAELTCRFNSRSKQELFASARRKWRAFFCVRERTLYLGSAQAAEGRFSSKLLVDKILQDLGRWRRDCKTTYTGSSNPTLKESSCPAAYSGLSSQL